MLRQHRLPAVFALLVLLVCAGLTMPAFAHEQSEIGPFIVVTGWENEPVIVGERNALVLQITRDGAPVDGLEADLKVQVSYAGRTFIGNLEPTGESGWYRVPILPTVRGQYDVLLTGTVDGVAINGTIEPEEVLSASTLQFPEMPPDNQTLADRLADEIQTIQKLAIAGIAIGIIGLALSGANMARRRK